MNAVPHSPLQSLVRHIAGPPPGIADPKLAHLLLAFCLIGCSGTPPGYGSGPSPTQVAITGQPANQFVPIGRPATFTVTATGSAPRYQWSENGTQIPGATSASYSTPNVTAADSGSTFQVTVSNAANSVTSSSATLSAGPRAPALGDLRYLLFQQVTASGFGAGGTGEASGVENGHFASFTNALGSPLFLGSGSDCNQSECGYRFFVYSLPSPMSGLSNIYQAGGYDGSYSDFNTALLSSSVVAPNSVITSLDLEAPAQTFGLAWVTTSQGGGFDYRMEAVPPAQIQATVAADGGQSRVVTAVTFDTISGNAILISYGWQGDTTTVYDAQTMVATDQNVATAASTLASQGYFISAFGGNDTSGYILVGMRVHGDTLARPISVGTQNGTVLAVNPNSAYYSTVVYLGYYGNYVLAQEQ